MRALLSRLIAIGVADEDINVGAMSVKPEEVREDDPRTRDKSRAQRSLELTIRDLNKYEEIVAALIASDATYVDGVRVHSEDDHALTLQAQRSAMIDARERADALAADAHLIVSGVHSISEFSQRESDRQGYSFTSFHVSLRRAPRSTWCF